MCAPELELTLGDMIAALSLVSRRQAEEEQEGEAGGKGEEGDGQGEGYARCATSYAPLGVRTSWREWAVSFWAGRAQGRAGWALLHEASAQGDGGGGGGGGGGGAARQAARRVASSEQREARRAMWLALSAYGWPLYVYRRSGRCFLAAPRALCSLCAAALRGSGGRGRLGRSGGGGGATRGVAVRHATAVIEGNPCCTQLDEAALLVSLADMHLGRGVDGGGGAAAGGAAAGGEAAGGEAAGSAAAGGEAAGGEGAPHTVWRGVFRNDVHRTPYFVSAHAAAQQLVICVRGSLSLADAATDLTADATPLPRGVDGDEGGGGEPQYAHRGMLCAAEGLLLDLERCAVLEAPCPGPDHNLRPQPLIPQPGPLTLTLTLTLSLTYP